MSNYLNQVSKTQFLFALNKKKNSLCSQPVDRTRQYGRVYASIIAKEFFFLLKKRLNIDTCDYYERNMEMVVKTKCEFVKNFNRYKKKQNKHRTHVWIIWIYYGIYVECSNDEESVSIWSFLFCSFAHWIYTCLLCSKRMNTAHILIYLQVYVQFFAAAVSLAIVHIWFCFVVNSFVLWLEFFFLCPFIKQFRQHHFGGTYLVFFLRCCAICTKAAMMIMMNSHCSMDCFFPLMLLEHSRRRGYTGV